VERVDVAAHTKAHPTPQVIVVLGVFVLRIAATNFAFLRPLREAYLSKPV
jgi:hypothetical protein